jgi:hypothetical protein
MLEDGDPAKAECPNLILPEFGNPGQAPDRGTCFLSRGVGLATTKEVESRHSPYCA